MDSTNKNVKLVIRELEKLYKGATIELVFSTPFEMLVATILSAQCTDKRVNLVSKDLFQKYNIIQDYLEVALEELEQDIYSTGFFKAKAKNIKGAAKLLIEKFAGVMPDNIDDLLSLPGVGRKTANVILGNYFGQPAIVVDTHVKRISNKLKWTNSSNPTIIERDLMSIIPKKYWVNITHYLIRHGRAVCVARSPKCQICSINKHCPSKLQK